MIEVCYLGGRVILKELAYLFKVLAELRQQDQVLLLVLYGPVVVLDLIKSRF